MSYAFYEPLESLSPQVHSSGQFPGQLAGPNGQMPARGPQMRKPVVEAEVSKAVEVPQAPTGHSKWADISEYEEINDWVYIIIGVLIIEVAVISLTRFFPDVFGKSLNIWYNRFGLLAVLADIVIILIGFAIARYVYTEWVYPAQDWNPAYFTGTAVGIQLVHDILFYLGVIRQVPQGQNSMMDVFKDYAESGGAKILAADSAMVIGSSIVSMLLKAAPPHVVVSVALITAYVLPYVMTARNNFSNIV